MSRFGLILGLLVLLAQSAFAGGDVEMVHVLRPKSDLRIKIEVIANAKEYIDFITYHHDNTDSSALLMESLRLASLRGVRVRYIYDTMATKKGASDFSSAYFARLQQAGVEIRAVTLRDRLSGWGPFRLIHSKILLADGADGKEIAIVGGRNVGDRYMDWLDNTFVLRYKKATKFSDKLRNYFYNIWTNLSPVVPVEIFGSSVPTEKMYSSTQDLKTAVQEKFGSDQSTSDVVDFYNFLNGRMRNGSLPYFQFKFSQIRPLSSGLMERMKGENQSDEISDVFDQMTRESKSLEISTILFYLTPHKKEILNEFLKKNGELKVVTNDIGTFPTVLGGKTGVLAESLEKMQQSSLIDLSKAGIIKTYVSESKDFSFNHAKHMISDKGVLITSSNFNYSSDTQAEENGFYIESDVFTDYMTKYATSVRDRHFKEVDYDKGVKLSFAHKSCRIVLKNVF